MNIAPGKVRVVTAIRGDVAQAMTEHARILSMSTSQLYERLAENWLKVATKPGGAAAHRDGDR